MSDYDFNEDLNLEDLDFNEDLELAPKIAPPVDASLQGQSIYPEVCRSPLFLDWDESEEDRQLAALGWFLQWRKTNPFRLEERSGTFALPPEDLNVWRALKERMIDWAYLEKGGLDLDATHAILLRRHHIRLAITPLRKSPPPPASAGPLRKEVSDVRKPQQGHLDRQPGQRPGTKNDPSRHGAMPLQFGDD